MRKSKKSTSKVAVVTAFLIVIALGITICFCFFLFDEKDTDDKQLPDIKISTENYSELYEALGLKGFTVDSFFEKNSTVISKISVNDSSDISTESEAYLNFTQRGFTEYEITTNYDISGEYYETKVVSGSSDEPHPYYETFYISSNDEIWVIMEVNGAVIANPLSYNEQSDKGAQLLLSESETIMSYDNDSNLFYETIPNESAVIVKTVENITADTLEKLTIGAIDEL